MSQWKNDDSAANSVLWGVSGYNKAPTAANRNAFFGNTTNDAYITGMDVGQFGVDATEMGVSSGVLIEGIITFAGSGYGANAAVTVSGGGGTSGAANAQANATGRISAINISNAGSSYETNPTIVIAAPAAVVFNGNTNVSGALITTASAGKFAVGDKVTYAGNVTSTPAPLIDTGTYFISFANSTVVALAATKGGANIALTDASGDGTTAGGATITGETATGVINVSGAKNRGVAHAGWNVRKVGFGGRAGRVQYETLVAMGSMTGDAEDTVLPDA